jgi:Family of unknown function (DUF6788)
MIYKNSLRRLTVRQLRARRARLARQLPDVEAMLRGALQRQHRQCGKAGCRCTQGELHGPYIYLAVRTGPRSRLLYVPAAVAPAVTRRVATTGRIEAALAEISAINLELFARDALD